MKYPILLLILFAAGLVHVNAQTDTEFWFAVPEVSQGHADRPVYLKISSMDEPSTIFVTVPANPVVPPIKTTLAPFSTVTIDLTSRIDYLENRTEDVVLNNGLYIQASSPITAYYEVLGTGPWGIVNCDIFALKGSNALGKKFYLPFQNHWNIFPGIGATASIDIVATEDGTIVTITPTADLMGGHPAGVPYNVSLNKGQTYSAVAAGITASAHPSGTIVTSNKPIAVTFKDDSIMEGLGQPSYDLAGDQLIPETLLGTEYIAAKASDTLNTDRIFICATKDNTSISIGGSTVATINEQETYMYHPGTTDIYSFIETSEPAYVFHVGGYGNELGGAILPPVNCTGSRRVSFVRPNAETFKVNITVKSGKEYYFTSSFPLTPWQFSYVPGSGSPGWKAAQVEVSLDNLSPGGLGIVSNDSADFHLSIFSGGLSTGFRYGYFSDFAGVELGPDKTICSGDSILLNAGFGKGTYLWNTGAVTQKIYVKDSAKYWVDINKGGCPDSDTMRIHFFPEVGKVLGNDTAACANAGLVINMDSVFVKYNWSTGAITPSIIPTASGDYWVQVTNKNGCKKKDTINVTLYPTPKPVITYTGQAEVVCWEELVYLDAGPGFTKYLWHNGDTTQTIISAHVDEYRVKVTDANNCTDSVSFILDCSPFIEVYNLFTPDGNGQNELFYVKGLKPGKWKLEVFNRKGARVYYNESYNNDFYGEGLDNDIYYYELDHVEGIKSYKGWVHIANVDN